MGASRPEQHLQQTVAVVLCRGAGGPQHGDLRQGADHQQLSVRPRVVDPRLAVGLNRHGLPHLEVDAAALGQSEAPGHPQLDLGQLQGAAHGHHLDHPVAQTGRPPPLAVLPASALLRVLPQHGAAAVALDVAQHHSLAGGGQGHGLAVHEQTHLPREAGAVPLPQLPPAHEAVPELVDPAMEEHVRLLVPHLVELQHYLGIHTHAAVVLEPHGSLGDAALSYPRQCVLASPFRRGGEGPQLPAVQGHRLRVQNTLQHGRQGLVHVAVAPAQLDGQVIASSNGQDCHPDRKVSFKRVSF
mmetsp:Transcript_28823/g.41075  ORF Transcript_28823/g.41075 Transcript_28823/m.41075 type:complete len:299 (-) Transcript_28823:689-1585(-)